MIYDGRKDYGLLMTWETKYGIRSQRGKLKIEKRRKDSLSHEYKEEIYVISHKSMDLLTSRILNTIINNNNNV